MMQQEYLHYGWIIAMLLALYSRPERRWRSMSDRLRLNSVWGRLKPGDKLIVAGATLMPLVFSVVFAVTALTAPDYWREARAALAAICLGLAAAAGLITAGMLLRKQQ